MKPIYIQFLEKYGKKRIFTKNDCDLFYGYDSRKILGKYKKDGYIKTIKKGTFFIVKLSDEKYIDVSPFFFIDIIGDGEGYISHGTALEYYGINEQFYNSNIVSVYNKYQIKDIQLLNYKYRITSALLPNDEGVTYINVDGKDIKITNLERTILDCFSRPDLCGGLNNIVKAFYEAHDEGIINYKRLYKYLLLYKNNIKLAKMVGYFIDIFNIKCGDEIYTNIFEIANKSNYIKIRNNIKKENAIYNHQFKIILDKYDNFISLIKY